MDRIEAISTKFIALVSVVMPMLNDHGAIVLSDFLLGLPVHVLFFSFLGSFIGVWNQQYPDRKEMWKACIISMMFTVCALVIIPRLFTYTWDDSAIQGAVALFSGYTAQTWGPILLKLTMDWIKRRGKEKTQ